VVVDCSPVVVAARKSVVIRSASVSSIGSNHGNQGADSFVDVLANRADLVEGLAWGVGEVPVEVALAGEDGAGVAASHGDF
jgi:hypothetical protein